jgi:thioredoxin 1
MIRLFTLLLLILTATVACAELPSADNNAIRAALASGRPTLADFGVQDCPPCIKMAPIMEEASRELSGKANILFIDLTKDKKLGKLYGVRMIPTQIFFNAQGKEVKRHIGFMDKEAILQELKRAGLK